MAGETARDHVRTPHRRLRQPGTATVDAAMPPTGKAFAVTQTHWFRTRDGMITEHWANRDDLAMARQAGWVPPSPAFLLHAALAKRRAQKHTP